jgi:hypothetical protein
VRKYWNPDVSLQRNFGELGLVADPNRGAVPTRNKLVKQRVRLAKQIKESLAEPEKVLKVEAKATIAAKGKPKPLIKGRDSVSRRKGVFSFDAGVWQALPRGSAVLRPPSLHVAHNHHHADLEAVAQKFKPYEVFSARGEALFVQECIAKHGDNYEVRGDGWCCRVMLPLSPPPRPPMSPTSCSVYLSKAPKYGPMYTLAHAVC